MTPCIYSIFTSSVCRMLFGRIRLQGTVPPEKGRPTLYLGIHKNGLFDEWVVSSVLQRPVKFLTPLSIEENPLENLLTCRLELNEKSPLPQAVQLLAQGGSLFIFAQESFPDDDPAVPYVELAQDATQIASQASQKRADLRIVPVSLYYEALNAPQIWGGNVEVLFGDPITPPYGEFDRQKFAASIQSGMRIVESPVSLYSSRISQCTAAKLARLVSLDEGVSYALALQTTRQLSDNSPVVEAWDVFRECAASRRARTLNDLPIFPTRSLVSHGLEFILSSIPVVANGILNWFPLLIAYLFSRPSRKCVFTPRRKKKLIFAAIAAWMLWTPLLWFLCWTFDLPELALLHLLVSVFGGYCTDIFRTGKTQFLNGARHPDLTQMQDRLRRELISLTLQEELLP